MKCPNCNKPIDDAAIRSEAARLNGRRSRRHLTTEQARAMGLASARKRKQKKKESHNEDS